MQILIFLFCVMDTAEEVEDTHVHFHFEVPMYNYPSYTCVRRMVRTHAHTCCMYVCTYV